MVAADGPEIDAVVARLVDAFTRARLEVSPYRHWLLDGVFPDGLTEVLRGLPFPATDLGGVSGKRELHNDQRHYFDAANQTAFPACRSVAGAFQARPVVEAIEALTGADLTGSRLRIEFAHDGDGFWLEPHTDLGVKLFTMLIYLPESADQIDLGTDVYADRQTWAKRPPFVDNTALVFKPANDTWHGLEPRSISGLRKSLIINYVTAEWRAVEQLAFPDQPVRA